MSTILSNFNLLLHIHCSITEIFLTAFCVIFALFVNHENLMSHEFYHSICWFKIKGS